MTATPSFLRSSIGKKWVVALTGLVMFGFVVVHMLGNLQVFLGAGAMNHYGALLHTWPEALWIVRSLLIAALVLHVVFAIRIAIENRRARPVKYEKRGSVQTRLSTRLMALSGLVLLGFIIFHLLHYTTHDVRPEFAGFRDEQGRADVFRMVVEGFTDPLTSALYIVAMVLLCSHLSHGAWSWLQTLGLRTKKIADDSSRGARIVAVLLAAGYIAIPAAVLSGFGADYVAERQRAEQILRDTAPLPGGEPQITPAK